MADAVLDMVANPTADSSSKSLSEDSDAVLCVPPLLVQYGRFMLEKPPVAWIVIAPTLPMFLSQLHSAAAKWSGSPLGAIGSGSAAVFPMLAMTVFSFRRVTRAEGQLGLLGLGEVRVSSVAARHLQRWGLAGLVCTAMAVVGGLANAIVKQAVLGLPSDGNPSHVGLTELTSEQRLRSLNLGLFGIFTAPFIFGWWLALKTASLLVSDCVIEARKKVASTSPTDDAWDEFVVPMMLQLLQSTLPALSTGFADGVILAFVTCWILSLGSFCNWLATGIPGMLIGIFTMAMAPLLLAMDVADASSECDNIRSTLNDKRAKNMTIEADAKIQLVERLLQNANRCVRPHGEDTACDRGANLKRASTQPCVTCFA
eukprot:SAG31_NODE_574_length_13967_cov_7.512042_17_plen_371_part_00